MTSNRQSTRSVSASNDHLSQYLKDFVPDEIEGDDRFLDLITWNIKFFNNREPQRVETIISILRELNADLFVFQEIELGSLDDVASELTQSGAGLYKVAYGTTGGDLRVAFMYDMEWVKASMNISELFIENPTVQVSGRQKPVFPRLPLRSTFVAYPEEQPFDFHLVGVHLKSQRGGGQIQRAEAAKLLAEWVTTQTTDEDVIIAGDWNAPTDRPEWEPIRELEAEGLLKFQGWNLADEREASYLFADGQRSRIDLIVVTETIDPPQQTEATVLNWNALLKSNNALSIVKETIDTISDHLSVLTRFYFSDVDQE